MLFTTDTSSNKVLERLKQDSAAVFARHETFTPRFGWLKKGFEAVVEDPEVFLDKDASVKLGVGKNMVKSIRYWCMAFKLIEEITDKTTRKRTYQPTEFGSQLLGTDGWDPFLEKNASLWLLHWRFLQPSCHATSWFFAFNGFRFLDFSADDLYFSLRDFCDEIAQATAVSDSSLKSDISCFLRMYGGMGEGKGPLEDTINSPFSALGLVRRLEGSKKYQFRVGPKQSLPDELVVASCLEYAAMERGELSSINVQQLLFGVSSPGQVFKLTESAICGAIERASKQEPNISLSDTAGLLQLQFKEKPQAIADRFTASVYSKKRKIRK